MPQFAGTVVADLISLRFPESGRLAWLKCHPGQIIKKGDRLAGLDPKTTQTQLDIELADFRRSRAEFDQLTRQLPTPKTEDEKTRKEIAQSKLDVAVKTVEKTKIVLDGLILISPSDAVVISISGLIEGINLTPSGFPITLASLDSAVFEIILPETEFYQLKPGQKVALSIKTGFTTESEVVYLSPASEKGNGFFAVHLTLPRMDLINFRLGTTGLASW